MKYKVGQFKELNLHGMIYDAIIVDVDNNNYIMAVDDYFPNTFIVRSCEEFDKLKKHKIAIPNKQIEEKLQERFEYYQNKKKWHEL